MEKLKIVVSGMDYKELKKNVKQRTDKRIKKLKRWNDTGYYEKEDGVLATRDTIEGCEEIKYLQENGFIFNERKNTLKVMKNEFGNSYIFVEKNNISYLPLKN